MINRGAHVALLNSITGTVFLNEPMRGHTTLKVGGPADVLVIPKDINELQSVFKIASFYHLPVTVIGSGSNLLVSDEGIEGIVVKLGDVFAGIEVRGDALSVDAGCSLPTLAETALQHSLTGLESFAGIPGTVGGAVAMNAGTQENEIGDFVTTVTVVDIEGNVV